MGVLIYALTEPGSNTIRYVGKTKATLEKRLQQHISDVRRGRVYIPRHKWIRSLLLEGEKPGIIDLDECSESDWQEREIFWISYCRLLGFNLLNATSGGDGLSSYSHSAETKQKQSQSAKKRYEDSKEREKTGASVRESFKNPIARENLRKAREKIDYRYPFELVRYRQSEEGRENSSSIHAGKTVSEKTRKLLSEKAKGRKMPDGFGKRQSEMRRGKRHSEETRRRISEALKAYRARKKVEIDNGHD